MAFTLQGDYYITGVDGNVVSYGAATVFTATGYPNISTAGVAHECDRDEVKGQSGSFAGVILHGERMDLTLECFPRSSSSLAEAKTAATLPKIGQKVTLANFPVVAIGSLANSLNHGNWMYLGGGRVNLSSEGKATMTLPLSWRTGITPANVS